MASKTVFSDNLLLVLKLLSLSPAKLASELEVDKSVVSRWLRGTVQPSAYNLARLTSLVAARSAGFRVLDWERSPESLADLFGADLSVVSSPGRTHQSKGMPFAIWDQMISTTALRGRAYEGFFRSTRPHPRNPGHYVHEWSMVRRDETGLLRLRMGSAEARVDGWVIPLHGLVYIVAAEINSGTMMFGMFNGVGASRVDAFDGLILVPAHDLGRSPLATAMLCERIGELSGDLAADDRRYHELSSQNPIAPAGSIPVPVQAHLVRDFGPEQLARGGELLLTLSLLRSMSRGPYDEKPGERTNV